MKIKTLKELRKHVGEKVSVKTYDGFKGECFVVKKDDGELGLATDSDALYMSNVFWRADVRGVFSPFKYGHHCIYKEQLEEELEFVETNEHTAKKTRKTRSDKGKKRAKYGPRKKGLSTSHLTFSFGDCLAQEPKDPVTKQDILQEILQVLNNINSKLGG